MNRADFERLIAEEFVKAVPQDYRNMLKNVAFLVEEQPCQEMRREEKLAPNETLLGLYRGVPRSARGDHYGIGATVPDVIILFRLPIHDEAEERMRTHPSETFDGLLRTVVNETIWHEVGHYLGLREEEVRAREKTRNQPITHHPETHPHLIEEVKSDDMLTRMINEPSKSSDTGDSMDPIEIEKMDPSLQEQIGKSVLSESENSSSIDPEGGGDGTKSWWEDTESEKPFGVPPEQIPPITSNDSAQPLPHNPQKPEPTEKKGEPPPNLPTFEG